MYILFLISCIESTLPCSVSCPPARARPVWLSVSGALDRGPRWHYHCDLGLPSIKHPCRSGHILTAAGGRSGVEASGGCGGDRRRSAAAAAEGHDGVRVWPRIGEKIQFICIMFWHLQGADSPKACGPTTIRLAKTIHAFTVGVEKLPQVRHGSFVSRFDGTLFLL